jgi:hypothetical protein
MGCEVDTKYAMTFGIKIAPQKFVVGWKCVSCAGKVLDVASLKQFRYMVM